MEFEFWILDFLQTLHHPLLDVLMKGASFLGNGGILWIILTIVAAMYSEDTYGRYDHGCFPVCGCAAVQRAAEAGGCADPAL